MTSNDMSKADFLEIVVSEYDIIEAQEDKEYVREMFREDIYDDRFSEDCNDIENKMIDAIGKALKKYHPYQNAVQIDNSEIDVRYDTLYSDVPVQYLTTVFEKYPFTFSIGIEQKGQYTVKLLSL